MLVPLITSKLFILFLSLLMQCSSFPLPPKKPVNGMISIHDYYIIILGMPVILEVSLGRRIHFHVSFAWKPVLRAARISPDHWPPRWGEAHQHLFKWHSNSLYDPCSSSLSQVTPTSLHHCLNTLIMPNFPLKLEFNKGRTGIIFFNTSNQFPSSFIWTCSQLLYLPAAWPRAST